MAEENQIQIEIVLDDGSVQKGFAKIQSEGEKAATGLQKAFSINGFADLNAAIQLASKAFGFLKSSIKDGIEESLNGEKASLLLASALRSIPGTTTESINAFKNFTSELSSLVAVDDDVINQNAALLASLGRLSGEGLENATKAALDLSAGLGISLEDASARLAKAAEGNVTSFQKLGFQFTKGASDAQILSEALGQINTRFGGIAERIAGNTFEGVLNRLKVAFDDSNQALGDFITKSPVIREVLKIIAESFERSTEFLKSFQGQQFLDNLIIKFFEFAKAVNTFLITPLEFFFNIAKGIFDAVVLSIQGVIAAVGQLGGALGFILEKFGVGGEISQALLTFKESSSDVFLEAKNNYRGFQDALNTPISDQFSNTLDGIVQRLNAVKGASTDATEGLKANNAEAVADLSKTAQQINSIYQQGIIKTISASAQALGAALVRGSDAFGDFKNVVLGIIGDTAIQIGSTLVGIGIGIESLKTALATLSGGAAIAAGLALIALGGALKSLSGAGITANPVTTAATSVAGADISTPTETGGSAIAETTEARTPRSEVIVNVNGDILGDESSGRKIVELINSAFDASGVNLRTGIV